MRRKKAGVEIVFDNGTGMKVAWDIYPVVEEAMNLAVEADRWMQRRNQPTDPASEYTAGFYAGIQYYKDRLKEFIQEGNNEG